MAMNAFEQHGIYHLSPSSINLFITQPALWVMEKLLKKRGGVGASAHVGTAVETGIVYALAGAAIDAANASAEETFDRLTAFKEPKEEYKARIAPMVRVGVEELHLFGQPSETQRKVSVTLDELLVPVIGYIDFVFEEHGVFTDLKTSTQMPAKIKMSHARQVALYAAAMGNFKPLVTYVTPKKAATYALNDPRDHLECLRRAALTIQRFLAVSPDPHELAGIVCPDRESFYYADPTTNALAFETYRV